MHMSQPLEVKWKEQAELYKAQAENLPHGLECESLLRSARQLETASHMNDRLTSPGLKAPA